jgi:gluconolactonase
MLRNRLPRAWAWAVVAWVLMPMGHAGESRGDGDAPGLADCEQLLRAAGAVPAQIERFENRVQVASAEELAEFADWLRGASPEKLADYLQSLSQPSPDDQYRVGADSQPQPGVPRGRTFTFQLEGSKVFPGTSRTITVYVPSQYKADQPACLYVGLDGLLFMASRVFDNLIFKKQMPITIGVGVGNTKERPNRGFELDRVHEDLSRFILEEVIPAVERHKTPDGQPISLSSNPNDRAVGGFSSGGAGAFGLGWNRPDQFRRIFSAVGAFVAEHGAYQYAVLARKTEPKPLRIFLQDGSHDLDSEIGDLWLSNQTLDSALEFAGYQVKHVWGEGEHNERHGTVIFPDAMRWLWKDWPQPIVAGQSRNSSLNAILLPDEDWHALGGEYEADGMFAVDPAGTLEFHDTHQHRTRALLPNGQFKDLEGLPQAYAALALGPEGRIYVSEANVIATYSASGRRSTIAHGIGTAHLLVTHDNQVYIAEDGVRDGQGTLRLLAANGRRLMLDQGLNHPGAMALSPDRQWLTVAQNATPLGYSYHVRPDGSVEDRERLYEFHVYGGDNDSGTRSLATDRDGRLYAATHMGVQVTDGGAVVGAILPAPGGGIAGLAFAGEHFDTLYVACADHRIYWRKLKVQGLPSWATPIRTPQVD